MTLSPPSRMKQEALRRAQPLTAYLELTYACNWRCVFCYNPRHHDLARLPVKDWISVLDDLRTLGALTIVLTGGEPLSHPDFFLIAREARARHFTLRIFTNGALIDERAAAELAGLLPQSVEVSLHGATAATHDQTTGKAGSFEELWRGVGHLLQQQVRVLVKSPLTRLNEHELEAMVTLVRDQGLPFHVDPALTPRDDGDRSPLAYAPSPAAVERLLRHPEISHALRPVQREAGAVNCGLGRITLAIDPEGNVFPCIQWRIAPLGNVRETRLVGLWGSAPERLEAAQVAVDANTAMLASGEELASFPFCPAVALQRGGNPLSPDPMARHQAFLAAEIRRDLGQ